MKRQHKENKSLEVPVFDTAKVLHQTKETAIKIKDIFNKVLEGDLKNIMIFHSMISIFIGVGTILIPHQFYNTQTGYNHMAHEFVRLYGSVTVCIGYFVYVTRDIKDGRLQRSLSETFALCYGLQSLIMFRAQFTSPDGHSFFHWCIIIIFATISGLYTYVRVTKYKSMKDFELPGFDKAE